MGEARGSSHSAMRSAWRSPFGVSARAEIVAADSRFFGFGMAPEDQVHAYSLQSLRPVQRCISASCADVAAVADATRSCRRCAAATRPCVSCR